MASTIAAGTTSGTALAMAGDTSGNLDLKSGTTTILALTATGIAVTGTLSASGVTTNAAGSAALPSITTTGDTDTGVWFPAANTLAASTAGAERMRIDSSGRVTMSEQPRFLADRSSDQTGYNSTSTGDVVVIYNATTQNVGSHFSTSTGKFTAPVAGMYLFQGSAYSNGGTNFNQAWLVVNGARAIYTDTVVSTTGATIFSATFLIYLSANDTVGYHSYNSTNTNQTITAANNHTWFKGYLIS